MCPEKLGFRDDEGKLTWQDLQRELDAMPAAKQLAEAGDEASSREASEAVKEVRMKAHDPDDVVAFVRAAATSKLRRSLEPVIKMVRLTATNKQERAVGLTWELDVLPFLAMELAGAKAMKAAGLP